MSEQVVEKIIDWSALIEICGYENMVSEIVKINLTDVVKGLDGLKKAAEQSKASDVTFFAHKLRGASLTMGALALAEIAHQVECCQEDTAAQYALERLGDLKNELDKVESFLSQPDWIEIAKSQVTE